VKKTEAFGNMLKDVKRASADLKMTLLPKLANERIHGGMDWRVTEGDDKGTLVVEVIERKREGRSRVPTATL
jgi:hypothetical protein